MEIAEQQFMRLGYQSVRLRNIADALDIKTASLYHHAPGGKEDLYLQVVERALKLHQEGLSRALENAPKDLESQLTAAMDWLYSRPRVSLTRMVDEMGNLSEQTQKRLAQATYESIFKPLERAFVLAQPSDPELATSPELLCGAVLVLLDACRQAQDAGLTSTPAPHLARSLIKVLVRGIAGSKPQLNTGP